MRKVLLASSALVAVAGVSAASADVTINVWQEFGYSSVSDNTSADRDSMFNDGEMTFSFSNTSDSGLTYSASIEMEVNAGQASNGTDEASMSLSTAEMGTITLGQNDDVTSTFATYLPGGRNMASGDDFVANAHDADGQRVTRAQTSTLSTNGSSLKTSATGAAYGDNNKIAYRSPNFGGITFGASYSMLDSGEFQAGADTGENADTTMGMRYSTELAGASVSVQAATSDNGEDGADKNTTDSWGVNVSMGDLALAVSTSTNEVNTGSNEDDVNTTGYGIGYTVNDSMSVAANFVSSEDKQSKDTLETTSLSLSYTIAPGLNFAVAMNQYAFDDNDDNNLDMDSDEIRASIQANF